MASIQEYPVNCPRGCVSPPGAIKRRDLAKHAEICPLEVVKCPFYEAGCDIKVLRKDLNVYMEANSQQHLMKMMTAYSKLHSEHSKLKEEFKQLSSQVTALVEPVKLTDEDNRFSFSITSSQGWSSPPFSVLDGYTFCIKHKEGRTANLMLLKGKDDDNLKWPMDVPYRVELLLEMQHETAVNVRRRPSRARAPKQILDFDLSANIERVAINNCSKEIANVTLPEKELFNYKMIVKVVPAVNRHQIEYGYSLEDFLLRPPPMSAPSEEDTFKTCNHCHTLVDNNIRFCPVCGTQLQ